MLRRILPHPLLTLTLAVTWQLLVNTVTVGSVVLGLVLGLIIPVVTAPYWPDRPRLRRPVRIIEYAVVVIWDIIVANVVVAGIILFRRLDRIRTHWIAVPLDITTPEAITVLAGTITMTPGTVSAMLSADGRAILVHCLDTGDPDGVRDQIKARYERRLKEIFE
ncbi:multicomponent K+:H+ antiporter subunit E [Meinhardsimonia xiamenensis]|jgi:multicomponent K+:H+ antiporter subunit E|uniref:Multicomponent K+:H+ antiporter subunit E n=1 Tax=Meinhardsimonia xiamenensis TaxID=990712 RepID=A0A1G9GL44_9RHOB|nr:Na+/H+ antiporter subunit E [Meinhardsimonia xiamenensis]PRX30559.1 multisubunit potassium/proton antiporter PhaE subunit [Meinhardsimonia xiamenensis]SDL01418.1 multicomponent K+:H+ antiporter subunit E [Meinhardsimonia xiamenensis]